MDLDNKIMRLDDQNMEARAPRPVPWVCSSGMNNTDNEWPKEKKIGVGVGVGVVVLILIGSGIGYCVWKRRRRDNARAAAN